MMAIPNFTDWLVPATGNVNEPTAEPEGATEAEFADLLAASYVALPTLLAPTSAPSGGVEPASPVQADAQSLAATFVLPTALSVPPAPSLPNVTAANFLLTAAPEITSEALPFAAAPNPVIKATEFRQTETSPAPEATAKSPVASLSSRLEKATPARIPTSSVPSAPSFPTTSHREFVASTLPAKSASAPTRAEPVPSNLSNQSPQLPARSKEVVTAAPVATNAPPVLPESAAEIASPSANQPLPAVATNTPAAPPTNVLPHHEAPTNNPSQPAASPAPVLATFDETLPPSQPRAEFATSEQKVQPVTQSPMVATNSKPPDSSVVVLQPAEQPADDAPVAIVSATKVKAEELPVTVAAPIQSKGDEAGTKVKVEAQVELPVHTNEETKGETKVAVTTEVQADVLLKVGSTAAAPAIRTAPEFLARTHNVATRPATTREWIDSARSAIIAAPQLSSPSSVSLPVVTEVVRLAAAVVKTIVTEAPAAPPTVTEAVPLPHPEAVAVKTTETDHSAVEPGTQETTAAKPIIPEQEGTPASLSAISLPVTKRSLPTTGHVASAPVAPLVSVPVATTAEANEPSPIAAPPPLIQLEGAKQPLLMRSPVAPNHATSIPQQTLPTVENATKGATVLPETAAADISPSSTARPLRFAHLPQPATNPQEVAQQPRAVSPVIAAQAGFTETLTEVATEIRAIEQAEQPEQVVFIRPAPLPLTSSPAPAATTPTPPASPLAQTTPPVLTLAQNIPANETQTIRLNLHPVELGPVAVEVTRAEDGRVRVSLTVEQSDTAQTLTQGLGQLRESLESAGVIVEQLQVATAQPQTTSQFGQHSGQSFDQPPHTTASAYAEALSSDSSGPEETNPAADNKLLSLHA